MHQTSSTFSFGDDRGRPIAFSLTPGNIADITMAGPLLDLVRPAKRRLAYKAYDADSLRDWLQQNRIKAVIPSSAARRRPIYWTARHTGAGMSSSASSAGSKIGDVSPHDTTGLPTAIWQSSYWFQPSPNAFD
jgi:transposase